jgi:hypothetical protein
MNDSQNVIQTLTQSELWQQDLDLLWQRWEPLAPDEQEWLIGDFVQRAQARPGKIAGLLNLVSAELEVLESLGWIESETDDLLTAAVQAEPDADRGLSSLYQRREGLKQLYLLCQGHLASLWLEGAAV